MDQLVFAVEAFNRDAAALEREFEREIAGLTSNEFAAVLALARGQATGTLGFAETSLPSLVTLAA